MPISPLACDEPYAPTFWFGKPCNLVEIKMPDRDYTRTGTDHAVTHDLLDGFAVSRALHYRRVWSFTYSWLFPDAMSTLLEFVTRQRGIGPFIFIDPHTKNRLTPNQASGTDALISTEGFAVTGTGDELSSSTEQFVRGERSLLWQFSEAVVGQHVLRLIAPHELYGWVTPDEHSWAFSGRLRAKLEALSAQSRLIFLSNTGAIVGSATGSFLSVPTTDFSSSFCITGTAPADACYVEPQILVTGSSFESFVSDTFSRAVSSAWGVADTGQTWINSGGSASDYSVSSDEGNHSNGSVNVPRISTIPIPHTDIDIFWSKIVMGNGVIPAGANITVQVIGRWVDANNYYAAELLFETTDTTELRLRKLVGGVFTTIATSGNLAGVTPGGVAYGLRFQIEGTALRARAWNRSLAEPDVWHVTGTDTSLTSGVRVGFRTNLEAGNTNGLPVPFSADGLEASPFDGPGLYIDELQLEMNDECTEWEYGDGQPLVSVRVENELVPRIRRTTLTYAMTEVTP